MFARLIDSWLGAGVHNYNDNKAPSTLDVMREGSDVNKWEPGSICQHDVVTTGFVYPKLLCFSRRVQCGWGLTTATSM